MGETKIKMNEGVPSKTARPKMEWLYYRMGGRKEGGKKKETADLDLYSHRDWVGDTFG